MILVESRARVDKILFESLICKLEALNSFLITLLDGSQVRRLQDNMNIAYLDIMQISDHVKSLSWLVEPLSPTTESRKEF